MHRPPGRRFTHHNPTRPEPAPSSASILGPCPYPALFVPPPSQHRFRPLNHSVSHHWVPNEFFDLTKAHFRILKCLHHLDQLNSRSPPMLVRAKDRLVDLLSPAFCSSSFTRASKAAADSWLVSSINTLKRHYLDVQQEAVDFIQCNPLPSTVLDSSLSMVCHWARKQLGRKLRNEVLDEGLTIIRRRQRILLPVGNRTSGQRLQLTSTSSGSAERSSGDASHGPDSPTLSGPGDVLTSESAPAPVTAPPAAPVPVAGLSAVPVSQRVPEPVSNPSEADVVSVHVPLVVDPSAHPEQLAVVPFPSAADPGTGPGASVSTDMAPSSSSSTTPQPSNIDSLPSITRDSPPSPTSVSCLILGDANLSDFRDSRCRVLALPNGRLSALRARVYSMQSNRNIKKVFVCLSLLDLSNRFVSNFTSLKAILGRCHGLFTRATLFVILCGCPADCSPTDRASYHEFTSTLRNKHPSNSIILSAPSPFACSGNIWSYESKQCVYRKILSHLN